MSADELAAELDVTRRRGYALDREESELRRRVRRLRGLPRLPHSPLGRDQHFGDRTPYAS